MNAVIYARYSSSGQREESIEGQIKVCEEYAKRNEYTIVNTYIDRALTGRNDDRPQLKKLIADSSKRQFQAVIVYSVDRFGRNTNQSMKNAEKLSDNKVIFLSATEHLTDTPMGRFILTLMMANAQLFSDQLSEKVLRGLQINAEKGLSNGGTTPFGYKLESVPGMKSKRLQINESTAIYVKKIYEMYANGERVVDIANYLNTQGIRTTKGAKFNKNSLHTILKNRKYIGIYSYGEVEIPNGVPRIISDELFNEVADIMSKNKKGGGRRKAKEEYLLTDKLFCGHCKEAMVGYCGTSKTAKVYNYYSCNGERKKLCNKKMVRKDMLEDAVIKKCIELLSDENIEKIADEVMAVYKQEYDNSILNELNKRLKKIKKQKDNLFESLKLCETDSMRKEVMKELSEMSSVVTEVEKEIAIEEMNNIKLTITEIRFFLTQLKKGDINNIKYRRMLIKIFVNKIYLYDDDRKNDRFTIIFNVGDKLLTVDNSLISTIENSNNKEKSLYTDGYGVLGKHCF